MQVLLKIKVIAPVNPTENLQKVEKAILNLFSIKPENITIEKNDEFEKIIAVGEGQDVLKPFFDALRYDRIIDTARQVFRRNQVGNITSFYISKEAAFMKHINFTEENQEPLGAIFVTLISDNLDEIIRWLTPRTRNGRIIE